MTDLSPMPLQTLPDLYLLSLAGFDDLGMGHQFWLHLLHWTRHVRPRVFDAHFWRSVFLFSVATVREPDI